jgi:hypothetical protein
MKNEDPGLEVVPSVICGTHIDSVTLSWVIWMLHY